MASNPNDILFDRGVRHAIFLERLKTTEVNAILGLLNREVYPDVVALVDRRLSRIAARGFDTGLHTTARLRALRDAIRDTLRAGFARASATMRQRLQAIGITEAQFSAAAIEAAFPVAIDVVAPSVRLLNSIATSRPFQGALLRDWMRGVSASTEASVKGAINLGLAQGETVEQMTRRIRGTRALKFSDGILAKSRRDVRAIVRTAVTHVTTHAREATYEANPDLVKRVRFVAVLDSRTTIICGDLDGRTYPVGQGERPPMHHQCRSTTIPEVATFAELGIPLREPRRSTRAARDADGRAVQVDSGLSYERWLRRQPFSTQVEVLGRTRAEWFRSGKLKLSNFVDDASRPLTIAQIRALEGLAA